MDWIERLLGLSPDAGDGSLEALFALGLAVLCGAVLFARRVVRGRRHRDEGVL